LKLRSHKATEILFIHLLIHYADER